MSQSKLIQRYTPLERGNHWIVAITFILAALSGLALFHPSFFSLSALFGGGPWTRILHPFIGVVMFVFFCITMVRFWKLNRITAADREWMGKIRDVIMNRERDMPEIGKYNAGQKYLFWVMVITLWLLLLSGILMWRPYFADAFPIWANRIAVLVHALSAFVLIIGIIVHIYAAIWVKGTMRAMTRGTVTENWAKHHHRGWYREVTGK
ncbi:MAG: formate dehydrogenase subunit gamma [Burkholderiales bacterium]|nr:formate dehydrogenase subunit gamma [Burkholderiales bacterium]